jgi:hypothetical protein
MGTMKIIGNTEEETGIEMQNELVQHFIFDELVQHFIFDKIFNTVSARKLSHCLSIRKPM